MKARAMLGSRTLNWDLSARRTIDAGAAAANEDKGLELRRDEYTRNQELSNLHL